MTTHRLLENEQMKLADYERKCKQQAAEIVKLQARAAIALCTMATSGRLR